MASKLVYTSYICYYDDKNRWDMSLYYSGDFCGSDLISDRNFHRLFETGGYANDGTYFDETGLVDR